MTGKTKAPFDTAPLIVANPRVLLVEDDPLLARALVRTLRAHGVEVTHVVGAADLAQRLGHYDVGIFDIDLPDANGVELAELCVAQKWVGHVVFFSATENERRIREAQSVGELISKSEGVELLLGHVLWACGRPSGVYGKSALA
jgi:DNA-binding NarL/FixJ family response regulator